MEWDAETAETAASWMRHVAAMQPLVDAAIERGCEPSLAKYLGQSAGMARSVYEHNSRRLGREPDTGYASFEEFVLKHGQAFVPPPEKKPRPKGFRKGRDKMCFMNATHAAVERDWAYVEGFAVGFIPAHHAWTVDADGNTVEATWKTSGDSYFGVVFPDAVWRVTVRMTGVYGMKNELLLEEPYTPESYVERAEAAMKEGRRFRHWW